MLRWTPEGWHYIWVGGAGALAVILRGGWAGSSSFSFFSRRQSSACVPDGPLVVARTEALIAGLGKAETLRRGAAYAEAGADAVLIHSKEKTPDEILEFCRAWFWRRLPTRR